jgi:2-keto-4-pentenoate hydratase
MARTAHCGADMTAASQAASDQLYAAWQSGDVMAELPAAFRPATRREGYAVQALLEPRSTAPLAGWKIAATSSAGQAHIGVDGPLAGRLLAERVLPNGSALALGHNRMRVAEVEFAFRMGCDLPPRAETYSVDEVVAAVATLHPAIEIPDSRYMDFVHAGGPQLIADNACAHWFVLGDATQADWRAHDLSRYPVRGEVSGLPDAQGSGANVLGDPRVALTWLANELSGLGITLRAGQVVTTGTCVIPMSIAPGVTVSGDLGLFGTVTVTIT